MTATEQLRKLLDERGVEWSDRANAWTYETHWKGADGKPVCASQRSDGIGDLVLKQHVIPEQAIAATLCGDECEIVSYYEASTRGEVGRERVKLSCGHIVERHSKYCQECGRKIQKAVKR